MNYKGLNGKGHTTSFAPSAQNSLILLYKYHWRSSDSPCGFITGGMLLMDGFQLELRKMFIFVSVSFSVDRTKNTSRVAS